MAEFFLCHIGPLKKNPAPGEAGKITTRDEELLLGDLIQRDRVADFIGDEQ